MSVVTNIGRPPGHLVIPQIAFALAHAKGDQMKALDLCVAARWAEAETVMKAAVAAGTTSDQNWATELADYRRYSGAFVESMAPSTIIGRLPGLVPVPGNTRTLIERSPPSGGWIPEGVGTPIGEFSFDEIVLPVAKFQSSVVVSDELTRAPSPGAAATMQRLMIRSAAPKLNKLFIDPTLDGSHGGPASITYGAPSDTSSGSTAAQISTDIAKMGTRMINAGSTLQYCAWVMHPRSALYLSLLLNTSGARAFPDVNVLGGTLGGLPVIVSAAVPIETDSETYLFLVDGSRILVADDQIAVVDVSRQSSIQLVSDPQTGAQSLTSLWATNMCGIRITRWLAWRLVDATAVATLDDVAW